MGCASSTQPAPRQDRVGQAGAGAGSAPAGAGGSGGRPGHSRPLVEPQKWTSKRPITREILERKRDEFWHTCQATNQPVVWQALREVCTVMSAGDLATANAICEAANIITPHGTLNVCYDHLGNKYEIPAYCICDPVNLQTGAPGSYKPETITRSDPGEETAIRVRLYINEIELKVTTHVNEAIDVLKKQISESTKEFTKSDSPWANDKVSSCSLQRSFSFSFSSFFTLSQSSASHL